MTNYDKAKGGYPVSYFPMTTPEEVGIRSEKILHFLDAAQKSGLELHRLMILRHGMCCAKITWAPYSEEDLHPLYSFSKSITATAVGLAAQEGLLSTDETIADLFPEDLPDDPSDNLRKCRIRDLLSMSCGHETEIHDEGPFWRKTFFSHPFVYEPGSHYKYNTAGSNILAAVILKKTGQQVTEYLRSRLFDPLGIGEVPCFRLPDDLRTEHGGGGMKMCLEDMARFTQFMLQDGIWEGKELLPGWYHKQAGTVQIETAEACSESNPEWAYGYGYQCWMGSPAGSFRADGAFGQFGLVYPLYDMAIVINAATEETQTLMDAVNQHLLTDLSDRPLAAGMKENAVGLSGKDGTGCEIPRRLSIPTIGSCRNPAFEKTLQDTVFKVDPDGKMDGIEKLVGGSGLFGLPEGKSITEIGFSFTKERISLHLTEDGVRKTMHCARDRHFAYSEIDGIRYAAAAGWRSIRRLEIEIRRLDALSGVRLILSFGEDGFGIEADETLMTAEGLGMTERTLAGFHKVPGLMENHAAVPYEQMIGQSSEQTMREEAAVYASKTMQGNHTLSDYYALPDESRVELIDGTFYDMASPGIAHQSILLDLGIRLRECADMHHGCEVIIAPYDVRINLDDRTVVQPDILVVCDRKKLTKRRMEGAPDFIAEILSPSNRFHDLFRKLNLYRFAGVREYWVVDPESRKVIVYDLEHDALPESYSFDDTIPVLISEGACAIDFSGIRKRVEKYL